SINHLCSWDQIRLIYFLFLHLALNQDKSSVTPLLKVPLQNQNEIWMISKFYLTISLAAPNFDQHHGYIESLVHHWHLVIQMQSLLGVFHLFSPSKYLLYIALKFQLKIYQKHHFPPSRS